MLACSCLLPDGWVNVPLPEETYDLSNPAVFLPLLVCMAPYGAVVFTIGARPAFEDGTVQDWAEYLAGKSDLKIERVREARVNRMPCLLVDATMPSEAGLMRSRSVFLEDGGRLYNVGTLAPEAIWASVEADFDRLLGSFTLDEVKGITAAPLRLMTSESAVDLSAAPVADPEILENAPETPAATVPAAEAAEDVEAGATFEPNDRPTQAADVALADDASSLDPENPINANLRANGVGLVPRVIMEATRAKFATVACAAIEAMFRVPFGWHVIDDGKRTLVFDPDGSVQINLDLRSAGPNGHGALLEAIGGELARDNPQAQFMKLDLMGLPCLAVRDLTIDGEQLDQAYLVRESATRGDMALVCRVTADRANMTRAMNTAEVILTSFHGPLPPDPEFAGQPDWWRLAVTHERADRLEEAEQVILQSVDHIGAYSSVAHLYEERLARLVRSGAPDAAVEEARQKAIHWLYAYAGSATSGGEGAALSLERDQRIKALAGVSSRANVSESRDLL